MFWAAFLELMSGVEPLTCALRMRCSAIEPHQRNEALVNTMNDEYYYTEFAGLRQGCYTKNSVDRVK